MGCFIYEHITDVTAIERILFEFKNELFDQTIEKEMLEKLAIKFGKFAYVVIMKNELECVGYAAMYCNDIISKNAFLSMIVIKRIYHGNKYGTCLLEQIEKKAITEGMVSITLKVAKKNVNAIEFYSRRGYSKIEEEKNNYTMKKLLK